jgi:hypothetical protein
LALRRASEKSGDAESKEAQVLRLQSEAGNRAVTSLLGNSAGQLAVQRQISYTVKSLQEGRGAGDRLISLMVGGTYGKIVKAVGDYHDASMTSEKLFYAQVIRALCRVWQERHEPGTSDQEDMQRRLIEGLEAEASKEVAVLRAEIRYEQDLEKGPGEGGFEGLSASARKQGMGPARDVEAGEVPTAKNPFAGTSQEAIDLVAEYGLTAAEVAAIRIYTLPDYIYINPSMSGTEKEAVSSSGRKVVRDGKVVEAGPSTAGWQRAPKKSEKAIEQRLAQAKDASLKDKSAKTLAAEGSEHAAMVHKGLEKLPAYTEMVFRGMRLSPTEFADYFLKSRLTTRPQFGSATKDEAIADGYAKGGGDIRPRPDQTVSVLCKIHSENARDIEKLSAAMTNEKEVLFFPSSKFLILDVYDVGPNGPLGTAGAPRATAWYEVHMVELKPHSS